MEKPPHDEPDDIPERERLWPGEIDLTGSVAQDDALVDVIYDAMSEVDGTEDPVPEWGARTLARALANQLREPQAGALHHFAVTGRVNREAMGTEMMAVYLRTHDIQLTEWIAHLDRYLMSLPSDDDPDPEEPDPDQPPAEEVPIDATPLDKVRAYLRHAFAEADERGETVSEDDARAIATLLAPLLPPDAALRRFATAGETNPALLDECRQLTSRKWRTPDLHTWAVRLEQYLAAHVDAGPPHGPSEKDDHPQVAEGLREHGDAFRAFLTLPDAQPDSDDLLDRFRAFYVGSYASMDALLDGLTEITLWREAIHELEKHLGIRGYIQLDTAQVEAVARETWDIVELGQSLYVFEK
ncbi:hypothetical protein GCM10027059_41790 [Myceligenerans halotolerans]